MRLRSMSLVAALLLLGNGGASAEWVWGSRSSKSVKTTAAPSTTTPLPPIEAEEDPGSPFEEQVLDGLTGAEDTFVAFTEAPDTLPVAKRVQGTSEGDFLAGKPI